ncbi:MAG: hypothetical protein WC860_04135 [Candidatus Margulisiibacteriota bacterium]|jgi:SAM-dependent methyltransferase
MFKKIISLSTVRNKNGTELNTINTIITKDSLPKWLTATSQWFAFGQPLVWAYQDLLEYKDKKMLDVLADGDLGLIALNNGIKKYVSFDVSKYACAFYELKIAAIKTLTQKEFTDFFIPNEIQRAFPSFTFKESEIIEAFQDKTKKLKQVKTTLFRKFKNFNGKTKYIFDYNLIKNKTATAAEIEANIKKTIRKNATHDFADFYERNFYNHDYPFVIKNEKRENPLYNWDIYYQKLRPLINEETRMLIDPLIYNSYLDEKNNLQPYARLFTIEETNKKNVDITKFLTDKNLYQDLQDKLQKKQFNYELKQGFDTDILAKAIANKEKFDIVSFSNVPSYKINNEEIQKMFAEVYKVLEPNGIFVFHINDPDGNISDTNETRESIFANQTFPGFKLIKHLSQKQFARVYHAYYKKDFGDTDNVLLMYESVAK